MSKRRKSATFDVGSFEELTRGGPFDLVMCLGVLSAIIDTSVFNHAITALYNAVEPSGTLLTKDTLTSGEDFVSEQGEYVAMYRNEHSYLRAFGDLGFQKTDRVELIRATGETSNAIYRFTKTV